MKSLFSAWLYMRRTQLYDLPNELQRRIKNQARYLPSWQDMPVDIKAKISTETGAGSLASVNGELAQHNFLQRLAALLELFVRDGHYSNGLLIYRSTQPQEHWLVQYFKFPGRPGQFYFKSQRSDETTVMNAMSDEFSRSPLPLVIRNHNTMYSWPLYEPEMVF